MRTFLKTTVLAGLMAIATLTQATAAGSHDAHAVHGAMDAGTMADTVTAGDLSVSHGWARAMLPGQPAGGAYLIISNTGKDADRLTGVMSPSAGKVEIHSMEMTNDVMVMRPILGGLEIPAGGTVELKPGGMHIMFMAVTSPFKTGDTVRMTLEFEKAGKVEVTLPVNDPMKAKNGG
ncbi:copper chaperone PCu(A)C [Mesorhizobium sp. NBSH29]|uniref:copper chaperone PCu(A)C n=1 Tax=Mesorhizobium sp. NBSH29 TaxID=2654249 RepID=UPI0021563A80|nr:copper chaperone PCu(A)C [Mesorhizobium sp. NBSH29]